MPTMPRPVSRRRPRLPWRKTLGIVLIMPVVLGVIAGAVWLLRPVPVDPTIAALVNPMLNQALPADLDRFSIGGDMPTLADCEGRVTDRATARYGDALVTIGGNVQDYIHRSLPVPMAAARDASGHWVLTSAGFTLRDASPADVQDQIDGCAGALADRMTRALDRKATRDRNATSWSTATPGH